MKKTFSKGGVHPPENKHCGDLGIVTLPLPMRAEVLLSQHIGKPADPVVEKGEKVTRGQLIAKSSGFVSASIHAPISGTVKAIDTVGNIAGYREKAIIIEASEDEHNADEAARAVVNEECHDIRSLSENITPEEIRNIIAESGIVGLGGATFPAHVKLGVKPGTKVDYLIINGCECEPYLTCDEALMRSHPGKIIEGVELMLLASGAAKALVVVEDNKPHAIEALKGALDSSWPVEVVTVKTKYPQGGEKQLVEAVTGRRIGSGQLPLSQGVIVNNVATAYAIYNAVVHHQPLIERILTVDGTAECAVSRRGNYRVAVGTPLSALGVEVPDDEEIKVLSGGPMMGRPVVNLDAPVTKGTSGLLFLDGAIRPNPQACIRCGACIEACPMGLEPYLLSTYGRLRMWSDAEDHAVVDCIECGCCSYSCPSRRPLLDFIRQAKQTVMAEIRARNAAKQAK